MMWKDMQDQGSAWVRVERKWGMNVLQTQSSISIFLQEGWNLRKGTQKALKRTSDKSVLEVLCLKTQNHASSSG